MPRGAARGYAEQAVLRAESRTMQAIGRKDARALRRLLDEEFVYRTPGGAELGREEFLSNIASMPFEILSVRGDGVKASVFGETAAVTGVQRARVLAEGGEQESVVAFTDLFVKRRGRWRLCLAHGVELPGR